MAKIGNNLKGKNDVCVQNQTKRLDMIDEAGDRRSGNSTNFDNSFDRIEGRARSWTFGCDN